MTFLLQFAASSGDYLRTTVPSVIIQRAPKSQIGSYNVLDIGGLHLLYDFNWVASVTNYTATDMTSTISPTSTMTMTSTPITTIYCELYDLT